MSRDPVRVTLFVPGVRSSLDDWAAALAREGLTVSGSSLVAGDTSVDVEWVSNPRNGSFGNAFGFGTVPPEARRRIDDAPGSLVLSWRRDLRTGRESIVDVVRRLRTAGALAVRVEQSKLGWAIDDWLELVGDGDPWSLHRAVVVVLTQKGALRTCGMHAFSLPDASIAAGRDVDAAQEILTTLNLYEIAEDPLLLSGQTFSPDAKSPRRVVERWPDDGYPEDSPCWNPYGVWRVGPPGGRAREQPELAPVFMPALVVLLAAREKQQGAPLSQKDVREIVQGGICMALKHREAQALERSRGYADLDPELAWEQWQVVRGARAR